MEEINFERHNKVSGIYIIFLKGGEYNYVGQSLNLWKRKTGHLSSLKGQKHNNKKMQFVYNKYKDPVFYELSICDKLELDAHEQKFIDIYYDGYKKCLNNLEIASSTSGFKMPPRSKEYRDNVSKRMKGRIVSDETRQKLRIANLGIKKNDDFKRKCSLAKKGVPFSEKHKLNISKGKMGTIMSEEWRRNIGLTKIGNTYVRGQKRTNEQKLNMSISQKSNIKKCKEFGELNIVRRKSVVQIDKNGIIINTFESITSAGNKGFDRKAVSRVANGKKESYLNCKWVFQ